MARRVDRLSAKKVETIKKPGYYCDGAGLYVQVSPTSSKSWIFRYTRHSRAREMGLGSTRDVSLAQARSKAADARRGLLEGVDPIDARDGRIAQERLHSEGTISFADCAKKYITAHRAGWRDRKHAEQWQNTIDTYAGPVIGKFAVKDIDTALVLRVLEPIWTEKPETAVRLRGRIERILDWARTRGYRTGENPARWRGHLDNQLPKALNLRIRKHHAALPYDEIRSFIDGLRGQEGTAARALEFLILTGTRTKEVIGAKPREIDLKKGVWAIPAERMKGGKEHRVPLSPRVIKIVKAQPDGAYLFAGMRGSAPLSNAAMMALLKRMSRGDLTVHGFRSTFRDWAAECTTYQREVCEMALAHAIGSDVEASYRRGDLFEKRQQLMLDWANYCGAPKSGKVVSISRRGA